MKDFHDLVAEVIDDFDCYAAALGFLEGAGGVAVKSSPGKFVDFDFERGLEGAVGVVGAEDIGLEDEEVLATDSGVSRTEGTAFLGASTLFSSVRAFVVDTSLYHGPC